MKFCIPRIQTRDNSFKEDLVKIYKNIALILENFLYS